MSILGSDPSLHLIIGFCFDGSIGAIDLVDITDCIVMPRSSARNTGSVRFGGRDLSVPGIVPVVGLMSQGIRYPDEITYIVVIERCYRCQRCAIRRRGRLFSKVLVIDVFCHNACGSRDFIGIVGCVQIRRCAIPICWDVRILSGTGKWFGDSKTPVVIVIYQTEYSLSRA